MVTVVVTGSVVVVAVVVTGSVVVVVTVVVTGSVVVVVTVVVAGSVVTGSAFKSTPNFASFASASLILERFVLYGSASEL